MEAQNTKKLPMWVFLALSNIQTRRGALLLIRSSLVFSVYCIPWGQLIADNTWVAKLFLIEGWDWFVMMVPMTIWYWCSLKWMDKHQAWQTAV